MKKNIIYIIGLLCIICVTILIDSYLMKIEGFGDVTINCDMLITSVREFTFQNLSEIDKINTSGVTGQGTLNNFFIMIDSLTDFISTKRKNDKGELVNIFDIIFDDPQIKDEDFITIADSYKQFIIFLNNITMVIIQINPTLRATINIPVYKGVIPITDDRFNEIKKSIKENNKSIMRTIRNALNQINKRNPSNSISTDPMADTMAKLFHSIRNVKLQCKNIMPNINMNYNSKSSNIPPSRIVYPFLSLIHNYVVHIIRTVNINFVPALNKKISNGAFRIEVFDLPTPLFMSPGIPPTADKPLPANNSSNNIVNALVPGPSALI